MKAGPAVSSGSGFGRTLSRGLRAVLLPLTASRPRCKSVRAPPQMKEPLRVKSRLRRRGRRRGSRLGRSGRASRGSAVARRSSTGSRGSTGRRSGAAATAAAIAAAAATATVMMVATTVAATVATAAAVSGHCLVGTADKGDADDREKHRDAENQCSIHPRILQTSSKLGSLQTQLNCRRTFSPCSGTAAKRRCTA